MTISHFARACALTGLFLATASGAALATNLYESRPPSPDTFADRFAPPPVSVEAGVRYWHSSGTYKFDTFYPTRAEHLSRLTYGDLKASSAETFFRVDHPSGWFAKGYFGGGSTTGGSLNDEDFEPYTSPYSATMADQKNGSLRYLSLDAGYAFLASDLYRIGTFVGYQHWNERVNTFGCRQIATSAICGSSATPIHSNIGGLDGEPEWNLARIGLNGRATLPFGIGLEGDVAYGIGRFSGVDYHNLRPDVSGSQISGRGTGWMSDVLLTYTLPNGLSLGLGGRWWRAKADEASFQFASYNETMDLSQDRYGVLAQAGFKFDAGKTPPPPRSGGAWSGPYIGAFLGYGTGTNPTSLDGLTTRAADSLANGDVLGSYSILDRGILGGAGGGYDWRFGPAVYGVAVDASFANIAGSIGHVVQNSPTSMVTTIEHKLDWLATARVRVGHVAANTSLIYLTGGAAFGSVTQTADVRNDYFNPCTTTNAVCSTAQTSKTALGWTLGVGGEHRVNDFTTMKLEYLYVDLGTTSFDTVGTGYYSGATALNYGASTAFRTNLVRSGLDFHF